ncbi:SCO6880 family protein [Kribbella ginsengisoli]|uniref:Type VII secretion protein EccE n=1 Tax=Kribbella ginsengisoli TaxID=363865 RepID=A0ABP6Z585_9ACTN
MTPRDAISTRFPRPQRTTVLLGLRPAQIALLAFSVLCAALVAFGGLTPGAKVVGLVVAVVTVAGAFARLDGLPAYRWAMLRTLYGVRALSGRQSYRAGLMRPRSHGTIHIPGQDGALKVIDARSSIAAIHDPRRRRLVAVARIEGPAHLLQNSDEQERRVTAYGRLIAGLCQSGRIGRAQILERTLPDSGDGLGEWAKQRHVDPGTAAGAIYQDLLKRAAPASAKHETLFSFALNLDAVSKEIRKHGGGMAGAMAVLGSEARAFQTSFGAAGVAGCWLDAPELAMSLRVAFDPAATRTIPSTEVLDPSGAGPLAVETGWDQLRTDSSLHRVYVVAEWPRVRATPSFLSPLLLRPGIRRTFSIVLQPIPISKALRDARRHRVERITDRATRARIGQLETEEDRLVDADVIQREKDLAAGHGDVRWLGLLVVSGDTDEALEEACTELEIAGAQALIDLRRLVGQQLEGFIAAALPFGIGLG